MLNTQFFGQKLKEYGFDFYSGVPCSFLRNFMNYTINSSRYVIAANEGEAVAVCAGAYLGNVKSVVLMQNSGLTNAISPLSSLNHIFKIPVLGFVSLRGEIPEEDEPQHELMGTITTSMLDILKIRWEFLADDLAEANAQLVRANQAIEQKESFFFVVRKNTFENIALIEPQYLPSVQRRKIDSGKPDIYPKRLAALEKIFSFHDKNTLFLTTTGYTGREFYEIADLPNNFYMVGSMGCVSSLGFGLALTNNRKNIITIDGDGALLMRMGALATIGYYQPPNLLHILLDNHSYDSTGGQATVSSHLTFCELALACGYLNAIYVHDLVELEDAISAWKQQKGLTFIHLKIQKGTKDRLGRPKIKPYEVKERFMEFINLF